MAREARSIAALTLSFGLVAIPVRLYSATMSDEKISFHLLHGKDGSRLRQQYVCAKDGEIVPREEMVKGYEFAKDQYVVFEPQEIKALEEAGSDAIDISDFVPLDTVDPVYFDRCYYLAPDKGGAKPYSLLATALAESGRCAIGRWAARGREHVVVIRPLANGLALHQLHFRAEVRQVDDLGIERAELKETELKLARQLIEQQASKRFDPNQYEDQVRKRIADAIRRKVEGQEIAVSVAPQPGRGNVIDLMEALKASLKAPATPRKPPKRATRAAAAAPATTTRKRGSRG
jgi:DNA end-binding protein Ku